MGRGLYERSLGWGGPRPRPQAPNRRPRRRQEARTAVTEQPRPGAVESPPLHSHWLNARSTQHAYLRDEPPIGRRLASLMASDWPISSHRPSLGRSGKESLSRPAPPSSCLAIGAIACHSVFCVLYWLEESVSQAEAFCPPLSGEASPRGRAELPPPTCAP